MNVGGLTLAYGCDEKTVARDMIIQLLNQQTIEICETINKVRPCLIMCYSRKIGRDITCADKLPAWRQAVREEWIDF